MEQTGVIVIIITYNASKPLWIISIWLFNSYFLSKIQDIFTIYGQINVNKPLYLTIK